MTAGLLVALFGVAGAVLGGLTGRALATGGYRIESDDAGALPRHWWWPGLVLALLWGFLAWRIGDFAGWAALPAYLLFGWLAVALVWIDADVHRLPDGLVLPAYPALGALVALAAAGLGDWGSLLRAVACMAGLFALYFVMAWISPSSLGFGDVKLAGLIGLVLGWVGVPQALLGVLAGFVVGGVVALVMLVGRRVGLRSHIAFGPAMLAGAFVALGVEFHLVA
ncbi:A24 family peptidase [Nostocoides sp. HKS02]|uniref:prepilin peptidase n=1 Tax=Nostocoides sp. HKS02 TaxID=1813880 RepID=UPI0012B4F753|nr:A24 family peptidase [Tetrasphaera sp. HKS02]QGN57093.1 prepilin peptidase [Tetrasphaera sp. HKS02]